MPERSTEEVGQLVRQRMKDLRLSTRQVLQETQVDRKTLQALLDGTRWPQEETRLKLEVALQWKAGSIEDLRNGDPATPEDPQEEDDPLELVSDEELIAELQRRMKGMRHALEAAQKSDAPNETKAEEAKVSSNRAKGGTSVSIIRSTTKRSRDAARKNPP